MPAHVVEVEERVAPVCPGCAGSSTNHPPSKEVSPGQEPNSWWCTPCLRAKIAEARAGECSCSQVDGPHVH